MVTISAKRFPKAKSFATDLVSRINALNRSHDFVRPRDDEFGHLPPNVTLQGLIVELVAPYVDGDRILISGTDIRIQDKASTSLALLFHELATNSIKQGALSQTGGRVTIRTFPERRHSSFGMARAIIDAIAQKYGMHIS